MTVARLARIIVLLTLGLGLAGCSALKLGYDNAATVAFWWLDSYIDFSDAQAPRVREDLARLQAWHRAEELPRWTGMLREMEELAPNDISAEQACHFVSGFRERLQAAAQRAEPAAVTLATGLAPEQIQHLRRRHEQNNADDEREWLKLSAAEQRDKRYRRFLERSEMVYGRLDDVQREALRRDMEQTVFDARRLLAERVRRRQDALRTLERITTERLAFDEARRLLRGWLDRALMPPEHGAGSHQLALIGEGCRHFAVLHNSTTTAQREAAVRRLRAYQRDLRELSAQR